VTFEPYDVVVVPFPFTDRLASKRRPALVLSDGVSFNEPSGHVVLAMITSAKNSDWPLDAVISDLESAGLTTDSIVRMKLFTLDRRLILRRAGALADRDRGRVAAALRRLFRMK
jgi:mRNA interferase MazF